MGLNNMRYPYIDLNLFRFLYKMPQSFGRGLDFNATKFPLKKFAKKILPKRVFEIIETGPHSYLSEVEKLNVVNEYLLKGPIYKYMRDKIDFRKCKNVFDDNIFHVNKIEKFAKEFKQGRLKNISSAEGNFLLMLALMSIYGKTGYSKNLRNY